MILTRTWLEARRRELGLRDLLAGVSLTAGLVLVSFSAGLLLARAGLYGRAPETVVLGWFAAFGVLAWSFMRYRRAARARAAAMLAVEIEAQGGLRRGSLAGVADGPAPRGSSELAAMADAHAAAWLNDHGRKALTGARRQRARAVQQGTVVALAGVALFAAAGSGDSGASFWRPFSLISRAHGPVRIVLDRTTVSRGGRVMVEIVAAGRPGADLFERSPGEPWRRTSLTLDDSGRVVVPVGPLETDRYFHAASGGRFSDTVRVQVRLPAFMSELALLARYPAYLARGDEPLAPGPDTILLPVGTQVVTTGQATVPLASAGWWSATAAGAAGAAGPSATLRVRGQEFTGVLTVARSGFWRLVIAPQSGDTLESPAPELHVLAIADSAPVVTIPIPGVDTVAPVTLKQPLVIDAHDDNLLTRVELVSRRVSRLGVTSDPVTEVLPLPAEGIERAVLQHVLDLDGRGFLPGDTAYYRVRAQDNRPGGQWGESREYILRLPSLAEQREAVRQAAQALSAGVDSLARVQRDLTQKTEDIAAERDRGGEATTGANANRPPPGQTAQQMQFRSAERANEVADQQSRVLDRADELRAELKELSREAWDAGLTDPKWHEQLKQLAKLLDQAITPELAERLKQLREALERLDAPAAREALKQLAQAQKQLREELERSRELFERAALEGAMSSLAQDADELARRQQEWNKTAERKVDSAMAREEQDLAKKADSLARQLAGLDSAMRNTGADSAAAQAEKQAQQAAGEMRDAAQSAERGERQQAQRSGEQAQKRLEQMPNQLRQAQQQMRDEWRREVMESLDKALVETADLAKRQQEVSERLNRGESGGDVRGQQAALRDGVDRVMERLQQAAGKNALVSPRLSTAMGFAKLRMSEALQELEQGSPNARRSAESAGEAVDGLNAVAYGLMRSRADVEGAESGSGFAEAVQRMAELAQQQNALNGQASGLLPMMQQAGQAVMQELQALANQQRMLAQELERMRAEGQLGGAGALAEEARELARQMESGRLDRSTVERQERLFRRLLDAGRTLQGEEEDDERERQSTTAKDGNVRAPDTKGVAGGPRYPYPTWEQLRGKSPEERRLILDYFRRLNEKRN